MMLWLVVVGLPAAPAHVTGRRELQSCGSATFVAWSSCSGYSHRNCYDDVPCGGTCEGDGECGTDRFLNNCGYDDVYERSCPTQRPTPRPTPGPTSSDDEDDDDDSDVVALVVSLCVVGAFLVVCGIIYAKKYYSSKNAKVAAVPNNAATDDDGDTITVEAPPGKLGLKFDGTSTRVKEVFSDSPLVGKVYPSDVLKSVNGVLTFGKYLAAAADDCAAPRTLLFLRKQQPSPPMRPATIVRMGTVEAVHAADNSAVQATLVPHATVISVQEP